MYADISLVFPPVMTSHTNSFSFLLQLFMPTILVSRVFVDNLMKTVAEAQVFCENNRDVVERMYGPPPANVGFQSFPCNETPYDQV